MLKNDKLLIGKSGDNEANLILNMANRHGIITGASGSGKTVTSKVLAESFSEAGVPVLLVDIKGDASSSCKVGEMTDKISERVKSLELENFTMKRFPTIFWDVFGDKGHPLRTTVSSIGYRLLSRLLNLSEAQEGVLSVVFKISEVEELKLIDLDDLKSILSYIYNKREEYSEEYGNISPTTLTTIQRHVLTLKEEGGDNFFGEPSFDIKDFMKWDETTGYGNINVLYAVDLFKNPTIYVIMLLWILNTLYTELPEVGDPPKPKLVFFIEEAHLVFSEMPSYLVKQVIQIVKLIRSKGVGIYFISQTPSDVPEEILGQLGNKVQHVLRSYTKNDEKALKAAANSFRENSKFNTIEAIQNLGTGEALISFQNENGEPSVVDKYTILPPQSYMGAIDEIDRYACIRASKFYGKYEERVDNESAKEIIDDVNSKEEEIRKKKEEEERRAREQAEEEARLEKERKEQEKLEKEEEKERVRLEKEKEKKAKEEAKKKANDPVNKLGKKVANKAVNKVIDKSLNKILKGFFK